ncbi:MAG: hypothetical protein HPY61_01765 [Methanotrichaceae archaeon]|nr:hypothetical protein [Methanotrichaceae archaeon]
MLLLFSTADASLERGVKGEVEDVILVDAADWHSSIAATPLAVWSEDNLTVSKPLLILPKDVNAGLRMGWVEQADIKRYGISPVLHTLKQANVSAVVIHGQGDLVKSMVEAAHKEGLKAYVTVTLEPPQTQESDSGDLQSLILEGSGDAASALQNTFLREIGLDQLALDEDEIDLQWLQVANPTTTGNASLFCPVNPEVREDLYRQIEVLIDEYEVDGVVLYDFGFEDENFCFCDVCKEQFYRDTGLDMTKIYASSYNQERWRTWRQEKVLEIVKEAGNITSNLGPVELGVAIGDPFDRSRGYNYADLSGASDFVFISPISASDAKVAVGMTDKPVYVRLSDDYVQYILSIQNVEGAVKSIEDLIAAGVGGFAFEYDVVYTPLWSELEPPSKAARWLLEQLGGTTLGIGNVSWDCDRWIKDNNSFETAETISRRWKSSPGAVLVGENYSAALTMAPLASYLNWPILFTGKTLPNETSSALLRLNVSQVIAAGQLSNEVVTSLQEKNLTVIDGSDKLLLQEMADRGESPEMVVLTNSRDLSLLSPVAKTEVERGLFGDLMVRVEAGPSEIPAEEPGEIVRLNITLTNTLTDKNSDAIQDILLLDVFPRGRFVSWPRPTLGTVNVTDPYGGQPSDALNSLVNGSLLRWKVDKLGPSESASLVMEVELLYPLDIGWKQPLDGGVTVAYRGLSYNQTLAKEDDWPVINITYPAEMLSGIANISWNVDRQASFTTLNLYTPDGLNGSLLMKNTTPGKLYSAKVSMLTPGKWKFNIEAGDGYSHRTENYTIVVESGLEAVNITAFPHTKVPRLSLVSAPAASARKALLIDVAKNPQEVDSPVEEESLSRRVEDLKIYPEYLLVVADPGSLPFIPTGLKQEDMLNGFFIEYELYRDYQLQMDDDNYTEVAQGRLMGLSVYDASQLLARTLAYDRLTGSWKDNALVISSPPLSYPQSPTASSISGYLKDAGLNVKELRNEVASYQQVTSQMNNGQNIVHFDHHGAEFAWQLSDWSMTDIILDDSAVKELTLSPQTTTAQACLTSNLRGYTLNVSGTKMYIPLRLEDSIALSFIRAGAVNYVGSNAFSWIFISEDYFKRFYQALVFENATIGESLAKSDNLFRMKVEGAGNVKDISIYDDFLPIWDVSISEMLNQTAGMNVILGDPSFRPALPGTPSLPYEITTQALNETAGNVSALLVSVIPENETATDWIYWIDTESSDGLLKLNAPPAIIAEVGLPKDADEIVVKENGLVVWHSEDVMGEEKIVSWPIVRPRLGEERSFQVEYLVIPGEVQVLNVTAGWNALSIYVLPKDPSTSKYLKNKPYRSLFTVSGGDWEMALKDSGAANVTTFSPGAGYLLDSAENFTIELDGKPAELPYRLKLNQGWNLIGVPFNHSMAADNLTVNAEHKRYSYQDAVNRGIISAFIWSYDGNDWTRLGSNSSLEPGIAYMIEAMDECRLEFRE